LGKGPGGRKNGPVGENNTGQTIDKRPTHGHEEDVPPKGTPLKERMGSLHKQKRVKQSVRCQRSTPQSTTRRKWRQTGALGRAGEGKKRLGRGRAKRKAGEKRGFWRMEEPKNPGSWGGTESKPLDQGVQKRRTERKQRQNQIRSPKLYKRTQNPPWDQKRVNLRFRSRKERQPAG